MKKHTKNKQLQGVTWKGSKTPIKSKAWEIKTVSGASNPPTKWSGIISNKRLENTRLAHKKGSLARPQANKTQSNKARQAKPSNSNKQRKQKQPTKTQTKNTSSCRGHLIRLQNDYKTKGFVKSKTISGASNPPNKLSGITSKTRSENQGLGKRMVPLREPHVFHLLLLARGAKSSNNIMFV